MRLPAARGPLSERLFEALREPPSGQAAGLMPLGDENSGHQALSDEDLQVALYACYELHYRGFSDVDDGWEWSPDLLAVRNGFEDRLETALHDLVGALEPPAPQRVPAYLADLVESDDGPSLSKYVHHHADREQFREFVVHRSIYHLHEADPHTFTIPRLDGPAKAALLEIQIDEYGSGRLPRMHAELFRDTMDSLGLDSAANAYLDSVPAITLATNNVMSLFALHRRLRGALLGQLAVFEMTSSIPNRRYGNGLRRLGGDPKGTRYYDEHVEADAVHEQIASYDMCGRFCMANPSEVSTVVFGAAAWLAIDSLFARHLLTCWRSGNSSLRPVPIPA